MEIVANDQNAINQSVAARNCIGWALVALVDKPQEGQVYLVYGKPCFDMSAAV